VGVFIAIEGGDGSGKGTQTRILADYAKNTLKKNVLLIAFPQHGEFSSYYAGQYLNGAYGTNDSIHPDLSSLPYALDRFAASKKIRKALKDPNGFVIADRYVASNLAHQGAKFPDDKERHDYYDRMMRTEYEVLGIPKPDINIVLLVPSDVAQKNVDKKDARSYTTMKRDILEADAHHLELAKANYEELTKLYPDWFKAIDCMKNNQTMRSIEDIQAEIQSLILDLQSS
jgi:dTMP kinase